MNYCRYFLFPGLFFLVLCCFPLFANGSKEGGGRTAEPTASAMPGKAAPLGESAISVSSETKDSREARNQGGSLALTLTEKVAAAEEAERSFAFVEALSLYLEAAKGLSDTKKEENLVEFENFLKRAEGILGRFELSALEIPQSAKLGGAEPIKMLFELKNPETGKAIPEMPVVVEYLEARKGGVFETKRLSFLGNEAGLVEVRIPVPETSGRTDFQLRLELPGAALFLKDLEGAWSAGAQRFLEAFGNVSYRAPVSVESDAKSVSTAFIIQELNDRGNPSGLNNGAQALVQEWRKAGYKLATLLVGPNFLLGKETREVENLLPMVSSGRAERIGIGTFRLLSYENRGQDGIAAKTDGTVSIYDVASGKILLRLQGSAEETGKSNALALAASFGKLGSELGEELLRTLP